MAEEQNNLEENDDLLNDQEVVQDDLVEEEGVVDDLSDDISPSEHTEDSEDEKSEIPEDFRRVLEDSQRKNYQLQQQLNELLSKRSSEPEKREEPPTIPPMPDEYDIDYHAKVKARDEALRKFYEYERDQKVQEERRNAEEELSRRQNLERQTAEIQKKASDYEKRAQDQGISKENLQKMGSYVAQSGYVTDDLAMHILEDDMGPSIVKYLATNPVKLAEIGQMSPVRAAAFISETIKPSLRKNKRPSGNKPPEPTKKVSGTGLKSAGTKLDHGVIY